MNYKNNLSLILASTMVSGMFSAAVNAKAYNFTTKDGNLEAYTVTTTDGKNVISGEGSANIELALSASGTKSQKVAFGVSSTFSDDASGGLKAVESNVVKGLKTKITEAKDALKAANAAYPVAGGNAAAAAPYAKAFRKAVVTMAEVKDKMSGASNAQELVPDVKELILQYAEAMKRVHAAQPGVLANEISAGFTSNTLPDGQEDEATTANRQARSIGSGLGANGAYSGICVGENIEGIANEKKYEIVGAHIDTATVLDNAHAAPGANGLCTTCVAVGDEVVITDAMLDGATAAGGNRTTAGAGAGGANLGANTFFMNRKNAARGAASAQQPQYLAAADTAEVQLTKFTTWAQGWFYVRAKAFLTAVEGMEIGAEAATWLGAGAVKTSNLNKADDYKVTIANGKNLDAVSVKKVVDDKVALGAANGATVSPLMVEFVAGTPAKEKTATGTLKISADGMKKAQEIPFSVTVGSVAKTDTVDVDTSAEQTVPSGYTFTKSTVAAIRNAEAEDFVINVLPNGTKVEAPVTMTIAKTKQIRTGERKIVAEISEDENANELYAPEENGKKKNDIAILNASKVSDGKVEYSIPVEVAKEELGELENGAKVYVYLTSAEKLEATKEKKAAAKKAEAKASANDGAVDSTRMIEGKVVDGKIVFTEDPSKISREEDEVFMMSKNKLDIKDAEEASAEEDKEEEEEEDEDEAEDEENEAEEEKAEGEEAATEGAATAATEGAATAATAGNDALTTEGTVVDEVTANEVPASTEEVSANAANGVAATGATAAAGIFGTMALASLAAGALATKKNKK